jgi:hypothetical protein
MCLLPSAEYVSSLNQRKSFIGLTVRAVTLICYGSASAIDILYVEIYRIRCGKYEKYEKVYFIMYHECMVMNRLKLTQWFA